jgi:hypothetical protein
VPRAAVAAVLLLALAACAARAPRRPSGAPRPAPDAVEAFRAATRACARLGPLTAELSLSGRAAGERLRGRVIAGLDVGGALRLEGLAPVGPPVFILAGRSETATLLLPRERRVLADALVSAVLQRLTGLALGAADLRLILSGCLAEHPALADPRAWDGGWMAVRVDTDRTAYLRPVNGSVVVIAADYGAWLVDYTDHAGGWPRTIRVRTATGEVDLTARIGELEVNVPIDPAAFTVTVPSDAEPMTLEELRSVAPFQQKSAP